MDSALLLKTAVLAKAVAFPEDTRWQRLLEQYVQADIDSQNQKREAKAQRKAVGESVRLMKAIGDKEEFFEKLFDSKLIESMTNMKQARDLYKDITQNARGSDEERTKQQKLFTIVNACRENCALPRASADGVDEKHNDVIASPEPAVATNLPCANDNQQFNLPCNSNTVIQESSSSSNGKQTHKDGFY